MTKPVRIKSWWRVETDAEGKVVKARAVESAGKDGGGVFYVLAVSEAAAGRAAFNAYYKIRLRARRAKLRAEGKCDCGRARDVPVEPGSTRMLINCSACLKTQHDSRDRRARREAGEEVPKPDKAETLRRRREAERQEYRLDVLREVNRKLLALGRDAGMRWLRAEIERLADASGKKVA